jgi:hypothetical protein
MKITVIVGAVAALALSSSAFAQFSQRKVFENPWDVTARTRMENDGWTFASTFGIPERMCYAMPPGKQWPSGNFAEADVRAQAIANGAIKFAPRSVDGKCHADDAQPKPPQ